MSDKRLFSRHKTDDRNRKSVLFCGTPLQLHHNGVKYRHRMEAKRDGKNETNV